MTNEFILLLTSRKKIDQKLMEFGFTNFENKGCVLDKDASPLFRYIVKCANQEEVNYCKLIFCSEI